MSSDFYSHEPTAADRPSIQKRFNWRMSVAEKQIEALTGSIAALCEVHRDYCFATCITCIHFQETTELCKLNNCMQRPPARIIANGCQYYEDEIPF